MLVIPAIDIKGGRCVRLSQGRMEDETVYSLDPADVAKRFSECGAKLIHVVDLDAAIEGRPVNFDTVRRIAEASPTPIEVGGGIRNMDTAEKYLGLAGVERIIIGTSAISDEAFVKELAKKAAPRIVAGIDAKDGRVAVKGWVDVTDVKASELALRLKALGIPRVIYTDISRDGMLSGPNLDATKKLMQDTGMPVIASGGVSKPGDLSALLSIGVEGVVIGKALYSGAVDLKDAIRISSGGRA